MIIYPHKWLQSGALCIAICGSSLIQDFKKEKKEGIYYYTLEATKRSQST
jgi:hypothetical protein